MWGPAFALCVFPSPAQPKQRACGSRRGAQVNGEVGGDIEVVLREGVPARNQYAIGYG